MLIRTLMAALLWLLLLYPAAAKTVSVALGSKIVTLSVSRQGGGPTCVALHSNERAAIKAVSGLCGTLIVLNNGGARNVSFTLAGRKFMFDPNRIFTARGRKLTLKPKGDAAAEKAVEKLALAIIREFSGAPMVGLHNNTNGSYSIQSYRPGGSEARSAARLNVSKAQDPDNFVLTTSSAYYQQAVAAGYNSILESGGGDDGSLSVYAKRAGRPYLNIEAETASGSWQRQAYQRLLR